MVMIVGMAMILVTDTTNIMMMDMFMIMHTYYNGHGYNNEMVKVMIILKT